MTLKECYRFGIQYLEASDILEKEIDAWLLLEEACGCSRNDLYLRGEQQVSKEQELCYRSYLSKRRERIPLQYILGKQYFMGLEFLVSPAVLIPRQDTEILVEEALKKIHPQDRILDVCTGSGCILISLLKLTKETTGVGVDLSREALEIAEKNKEKHGVTPVFLQSDLMEQVEGTFDMILSNPPYIASAKIEQLMPEVREQEPRMALDGAEDGLVFYKRIVKDAGAYLKKGGWLLFEIGYDQGKAVSEMMKKAGYDQVTVVKDLAGLDRVVTGRLQEESQCLID